MFRSTLLFVFALALVLSACAPKPTPAPAPVTGEKFDVSKFVGTYEGTWTNETTGASGPVIITIQADEATKTFHKRKNYGWIMSVWMKALAFKKIIPLANRHKPLRIEAVEYFPSKNMIHAPAPNHAGTKNKKQTSTKPSTKPTIAPKTPMREKAIVSTQIRTRISGVTANTWENNSQDRDRVRDRERVPSAESISSIL